MLATACGQQPGRDQLAGPAGIAADPTDVCGPGQLLHAGDAPIPSSPVDEDAEFPWQLPDPPVIDGFDAAEILPGGPPPDGIRPIDLPCFESTDAGDAWLTPESPVMVVELGDDARAYPLGILTRHEIANDVIDGRPVVVTYCPLCNSGIAFERAVDGEILDFGTSGRLYRSNLIMYDRQRRNLWSQFAGEAVVGDPWVGTRLKRIPVSLLSWAEFKDARPDGVVLARPGDRDRGYGRNPYVGYEDAPSTYLYRGPIDDVIDPDERVVGISTEDGADAVAIRLSHLREVQVVEVEFTGAPLTVWWAPGANSALDTDDISEGRDVGQTGSFRPVSEDGRRLTFAPDAARPGWFVDVETGSTWNLLGEAIAGPLHGQRLEVVGRDDTFWFVWSAFRPGSEIVPAP